LKRSLALLLMVALTGTARASGSGIFAEHCAVCHQADGKGIPGTYPPLADSAGDYVRTAQGRAYLIHVVSFGLTGPISVHGQRYNGTMQAWPQFSDDDVAQVLNHVLVALNAHLIPKRFTPLTADDVKSNRKPKLSFAQVHAEREALMKSLSGAGAAAQKAPGS
jgi:mono/diheme cytochrome c family protein